MFIGEKEFKRYKNTIYLVSKDGEVYSEYAKRLIKPLLRKIGEDKFYAYIDIYRNGKQRHTLLHRMVFESWCRELKEGEQVNHIDDNSLNNNIDNLYAGNQKDNIADCIKNSHRVGVVKQLIVFDKETKQKISFVPSILFCEYCGHSSSNGSVKRFFKRQWFNERYDLIYYDNIKNFKLLNENKGVTTIGDECNQVE